MDIFQCISERRSIRGYLDAPVEEEKIVKVLEAFRSAPSAANRQPWYLIVLKDTSRIKELKAAYNREWFYRAPVVLCACGEPAKAWVRSDGHNYWQVDVSIAFDHLTLAAHALGLGTCWIGAFDRQKVIEQLRLPAGIEPLAMTPLGYPNDKGRSKERKPVKDFVMLNHWGNPFPNIFI